MAFIHDAQALVVGIAGYQHVRRLPPSVLNDARGVHAALIDRERCAYPPDRVCLLTDAAATRDGILGELKRLADRATADSTVFVYVSSHGGRIEAGDQSGEYLLPVDADGATPERLAATAIAGTRLSEAFRNIHARKMVVVFDCCHSGGIGEPKSMESVILKGGLSDAYYDELTRGRGRVIIASSRSTESSYVVQGAANSLFTEHLLAALAGGATVSSGVIRVFDVFDYVQARVVKAHPNQHPVFKAELEENFPIALSGSGAKAPAPGVAAPAAPAASNDYPFDVFISYSHEDAAWVRKTFLPALKGAGVRTCIDYQCFRPGRFVIGEMERAVQESRYTVAVLTPAYLQSGFTEFENVIAEHLGLEQHRYRYLGILRSPCKPSLRIRARYWIDMTTDDDFDMNVARIVDEVKGGSGVPSAV